jgi:BirA family biotin operon repressor/biotin-[acetyl-CoA-carboxylase] ligase
MNEDPRPIAGDPIPPAFAAALARERAHAWADAPVVFFHRVGSTNDVALELAASGAAEGTMVVALSQTAGRGRRGRSWTSPPGAGVYFTAVLRPSRHARLVEGGGPSRLTLLVAVAVAEAVERVSGVSAQIKWPNDLVVSSGDGPMAGRRRRKLAGILTEAAASGSEVQHVVAGVGINLAPAVYPPDVVATSIESESGRSVGAADVFAACRASLAREYDTAACSGWDAVLRRWRERAPSSRGQRVRWTEEGRVLDGVTCGLDDDGALRIVDADGSVHRIVSGEVDWA